MRQSVGRGISIGGCIFEVIVAALYAAMFGALSMATVLGTKDILIMLGISVATFVSV